MYAVVNSLEQIKRLNDRFRENQVKCCQFGLKIMLCYTIFYLFYLAERTDGIELKLSQEKKNHGERRVSF